MKYFAFVVTDSTAAPNAPELPTIEQWVAARIADGTSLDGERIRPPEDAKTVRVRGGELIVTDGPFTESKEWITGWDIIECDDLDHAIAVMAEHPMARFGQIELRPFFDWDAAE